MGWGSEKWGVGEGWGSEPHGSGAYGVGGLNWAELMVHSYETIHGSLSEANRTELKSRLLPGYVDDTDTGYYYTTFGPPGLGKTTCDFVLLFNFDNDVTTRGWTVSGGTDPRFDFDGTIEAEVGDPSDLPSHTLGAGILTVSKTNGWADLIHFDLSTNPFTGILPRLDSVGMTALAIFRVDNTSLTVAMADLSAYTLVAILNIDDMDLSGDLVDLLPLTALTILGAKNNTGVSLSGNFIDSGNALLRNLDLRDLSFDAGEVDQVLADYEGVEADVGLNLATDYVINLAGTNAPPSAAGLTSKTNLEALGWGGGGGSITITVSV